MSFLWGVNLEMPTYAYQCEACGSAFEVFQKMSDEPLSECESCGGELKKRMFPVGIVFKGSGFYVNDYAKKESAKSSTAAAATETKAEAKADADTSTAPKSESKVDAPAKTSDAPAPTPAPA